MNKPRLLLADDHTLVLEGLTKILESDFEPVGTAENGRELLRLAEELKPDVVLLLQQLLKVVRNNVAIDLKSCPARVLLVCPGVV